MADLVATADASPPGAFGPSGPLRRLMGLAAQPAVRRMLPWFLGAAAIGGAGLTYALLAPAPQRILYTQLDDAERANVAASLDKAGVSYAINPDTGAMTVSEADLYKARMLVAADGGLASPDGGGALDSLPLGASRTLEGERLRAAREHELMLTIQEIDGVEGVRVHLAEAAKSVFVREDTPPTASVMVRMAKGRQLAQSQVAAVVNLVAGSVPGLSPDAVRVIDQNGRLLSQGGGAESDRFELQRRFEDKLRAQLDQLLTPMLGPGRFTSEIQVELDMDQVTSAKESYDKDGVLRSESAQQSQQSGAGGTAGGVPGALSNTPPPATTLRPGAPQAAAPAPVPTTAATNGESSATRTFELGRQVSVANATPGKLKRLSVAVALSQEAMKKSKPADVDQIKALVAAAVGADPQRGDQVTVMVRPFEPVEANALPFYEAPWFAMVVRSAVALIAVLLVLLMGVRPLIKALKRERGEGDPDSGSQGAAPAANPATGSVDAALLGRQVGLAQRIVEEKPDDALVALRQMLGTSAAEAPQ
ncbi:MAG: flagellar basal-body MS-ring/collar protein FliF [Novosphingobium sp.]|uniref:flagellar basal-body MS-ring/collar protein FliF n=1 Tax=Novosphingobium sp. TaxID=1874826 RepID=UPI0032B74D6F